MGTCTYPRGHCYLANGGGGNTGILPDPGHPASHGCIRLPKSFAPTLFNAVNTGTRVTIH